MDDQKGVIRRWMYFPTHETLNFDIIGYRFCYNIQRQHKSNNIRSGYLQYFGPKYFTRIKCFLQHWKTQLKIHKQDFTFQIHHYLLIHLFQLNKELVAANVGVNDILGMAETCFPFPLLTLYSFAFLFRLVVDLKRGVWYQKCYDPDCQAVNFKSNGILVLPFVCVWSCNFLSLLFTS